MATNIAPAANSLFERNADLMLPEILSRVSGRNVMIDIFDKGTWPAAFGDKIDTLTVERSFADSASEDGSDWAQVIVNQSTNDGSVAPAAGNSLPPEQTLTTGQTRRQMALFWKALQTENINLELIRNGHEINTQLDITNMQLVQGVEWELEKRFIYAYLNTSGNLLNATKVGMNANGGFPVTQNGALGFPLGNLPDMELEQGLLDDVWDHLENETHGDGAVGKSEENASVYMLLTDPMTSRGVKANNAAIRDDSRYAFEGSKMESPLLRPYGMGGRCYGNFVHKTYRKMPRYDYVAGQGLVRRPYWLKVAVSSQIGNNGITGGRGYAWVPNPAWASAQFTTSFIINTKVFKWLVPGMLDNPGGDTHFETPNYFPRGIQWLNERNLDPNSVAYNPDKTQGKYRAVMAAAIQPLFPTYGYCILHLKHVPQVGTTYISANFGS
jgi:hypothetical protein